MSFNIGDILNVSDGTWYGNNTFSYQWLRDGVPISGAISPRYIIVAADNETSLSAVITATNAAGSVSIAATNSASITGTVLLGPPDSLVLLSDTIVVGIIQRIDLASLSLTALPVEIDVSIIPDLATLVLTAPTVVVEENINVDTSTLTLASFVTDIASSVPMDLATLTLTAPAVTVGIIESIPVSALTLASDGVNDLMQVDLAALTLTAPTIDVGSFIGTDLAALLAAGLEINVIERLGVDTAGTLVLTDQTVTIVEA